MLLFELVVVLELSSQEVIGGNSKAEQAFGIREQALDDAARMEACRIRFGRAVEQVVHGGSGFIGNPAGLTRVPRRQFRNALKLG